MGLLDFMQGAANQPLKELAPNGTKALVRIIKATTKQSKKETKRPYLSLFFAFEDAELAAKYRNFGTNIMSAIDSDEDSTKQSFADQMQAFIHAFEVPVADIVIPEDPDQDVPDLQGLVGWVNIALVPADGEYAAKNDVKGFIFDN